MKHFLPNTFKRVNTYLVLFALFAFGCSDKLQASMCKTFFDSKTSQMDFHEKLDGFPDLAETINNIYHNAQTSKRIKKMLAWFYNHPQISVVKKTEDGAEAVATNERGERHVVLAYKSTFFENVIFKNLAKDKDVGAPIHSQKSNARITVDKSIKFEEFMRQLKNYSPTNSKSDSAQGSGFRSTIYMPTGVSNLEAVAIFFHELSHIIFDAFWERIGHRLAKVLPNMFALHSNKEDLVVVDSEFYDFVSEKYAYKNEYEITMELFSNHKLGFHVEPNQLLPGIENYILMTENIDQAKVAPIRGKSILSSLRYRE